MRDLWVKRRSLREFRNSYREFITDSVNKEQRFPLQWNERFPCLDDRKAETPFDSHYIYHPAWAARILAGTKPERHIDISSSLHFCTLVSAFIPVSFFDYRPARISLSGLSSGAADLLNLPFETGSVSSISCMHTVEHIGLGRYGDPIDYDGDLKAIRELKRVTKKEGDILFVTPVGKPVIRFNAHRIYSYDQVIGYFEGCRLTEFSLVTDDGKFIEKADPGLVKEQEYGCGCFWFKKGY
jgi:hypothetical protein